MDLKKYKIYFFYLAFLTLTSCVTSGISVGEGYKYDENTNQTKYIVLPFGNVSIPGKWIKTRQSNISYQQFFLNKDTVEIAVALGGIKNYEFNVDGLLTGYKFVNAFYEWDSKYLAKNGLNRSIIEQDSINNFIIWRLHGMTDSANVDTYFLIGNKNTSVYNLSVFHTDKWSTIEKVKFLKTLFVNKN
jgi:hypothetical protein